MRPRTRIALGLVAVAAMTGISAGALAMGRGATWPGPRPPAAVTSPAPSAQAAGTSTVYVHYYLWWTTQHWFDKLGPDYPYATAPIPGSTDAQGCNPTVTYAGAQIVDVPAGGLYDQAQASTFERHIGQADGAGLKGFLADWQGVGRAGQTPSSSGYDSRLDLLVRTVDAYDSAHGAGFGLGLAYAAFGDYSRPASEIIGDLTYFYERYGRDPAFRNGYSPKPMVMWLDSRKFSVETVRAVSRAVQPYVYLLGDETATSWPRDAQYLDGTSYYWSTQDPWSNPHAGSAVAQLAAQVHADGKRWFAPFIAGYDKQIAGGSCVARRGTDTLTRLWKINSASRPEGWFGISWNEYVENTYLEPTKRYGSTYLDALAALIRSS
jgi:hypothetical protein